MTTAALPPGPGLAYITESTAEDATHRVQYVDRAAVDDPRDRAICRALLLHALALLDETEPKRRTEAKAAQR